MIRHFNQTGRVRILREHVNLSLQPGREGQPRVFDLSLSLGGYNFDPDASIRVEAAVSNVSQRWQFGTVGQFTPPPDYERRMTEVPSTARFRIFVVKGDDSGLLLGAADGIAPTQDASSLLPIQESDDIGDEVWRLDFSGVGEPLLLLNNSVDNISGIVRSDAKFRSLVMPEVLRAILLRAVVVERQDPDDDQSQWNLWFETARSILPHREAPNLSADASLTQEATEWIDDVVQAFAQTRVKAAASYQNEIGRGAA